MKVYTTSTEKGPDGSEMESYSEYSDYKEVDGIKYPFTRSRNMGPQVVELTVTDIKVNAKVEVKRIRMGIDFIALLNLKRAIY